MSNKNNFKEHINKVSSKAKQKCGWIYRTFRSRNAFLMKTMWNCLVQPQIDYCSQLWMPMKVMEMQQIEQIQRNFTARIEGLQEKDYWNRLDSLKIKSQQRRLERYIIIYIWKIIQGLVPKPGVHTKISLRRGRTCEIPMLISQAKNSLKSMKDGNFLVNGTRLFNSIPKSIRDMEDCSLNIFKNALDQYLSSIPDHPRVTGYTSQNESN